MCAPTVSSTTFGARYRAAVIVAEASPVRSAFRYASAARMRVFTYFLQRSSGKPNVPVIRGCTEKILQVHDIRLQGVNVRVWRDGHRERLVQQEVVDLAVHLLALARV